MKTSSDPPHRQPRWNIVLIDDHPAIREALSVRLGQEPDLVVCEAVGTLADARHAIERHQPDLMVLDLSLPDGHGLEFIKDVHAGNPAVRLIVFSMHDENLYGERALRAGAQGYLMKDESPDKVVAAIRKVLKGDMAASESLQQKLMRRVTGRQPSAQTPVERLSDRELEVFQFLGQGMGTKDIAACMHRSVKTVETHRQRIKEKLGIGSGPELIARAAAWAVDHDHSHQTRPDG